MSRGGAILASLLVTLGRPAWWALALAGFLVRGGFLAFILPIVLLPSPLALSNEVAPLIVPIALGRIGLETIAVAAGVVALFGAWLLVGGWIAAATDLVLIRDGAAAAIEEGIGSAEAVRPLPMGDPPGVARRDRALIGGLLATRLVAWLPLAAAVGVGIVRIIAITYAELTRPVDVGTPLVVRVALGAAPELTVVVVTWLLGELVGGVAGRRIVVGGEPPGRALLAAAADLVRRPVATVLPWLVTTGLLLAVLGGTVGAASVAWSRLLVALSDRTVDPPTVALTLLLFVTIWLAALILAGLFAAARGAVQTFEDVRRRSATGTFGASAHHRPGDWSIPDEGGSL